MRLKPRPSIAFVPTMGNLHAGHIALVELAKQHAKTVVVSIFVNPLQFSPTEDLANYPRTLEADCEKLKAAGCDIVFAPSVEEIYADFDGKNLNQTMTIDAAAHCQRAMRRHALKPFCGRGNSGDEVIQYSAA